MLNPAPGNANQGYDNSMPFNTYDAALNVAYDRSGSNPLVLAANSSLISTISMDAWGSLPQVQRAAVLTVLASPAAPGSFRPPYCGTDKTIKFNKSALNYALLQSLAPVSGTPTLASVEDMFAAPWIDHQAGWVARYQHPSLNMPDYGREIYTNIGTGALMLHLNFTNTQKETLLIRYVQLGIDFYGVLSNGGTWHWANDGGQAGGRKWPILFAGMVLNDAAMKSIGAKSGDYLYQNGYGPANNPPGYLHFGEDDQTFYVAALDVSVTNGPTWNPDSRDAVRTPYSASDIGLPEWGIRHSTNPEMSNKYLPTEYRNVAGPPFHGTALAALLTPGGKALWNHNAFFDYTDRYMAFTAPGGEFAGWWRSMSGFTASMWDTYRAQVGPVWPATGSAPPVLAPIGNQQVTVGQTLTFTVSALGGSGTLTYSASGLPAGAAFSGQTFTWTPGATQAGNYTVTFTVRDNTAQDSETITITVIKPNSAPVLATIGNKSTSENLALTFTISATDADNDPITYSAAGLPTGAGLTGQTFSWTPTYTQAGTYNVTFIASDGKAQTSQTITITVADTDRPPVLADIANQSVNVSSLLTFTLSATDPDGDSLTYSAGTLPGGATLTGQTFAWTPASSQAGTYSITFTVSDGTLTSSKTASILVIQPNVAPVLATIGNKSVNENQTLTFTISATDGNGDTITYAAANLPSGAGFTGRTFSWTPTYTQAGGYNVTFTASDGQLQTSQTITITVVNVDRPPVLADIGSKTVDVTKFLSFTLSATDPDGDSLTYSAGTLPSGATLTGQTFAWTPTASQAGTYSVTFTVSDGTLTSSKTASILVSQSNVAPVLAPIGDKSVKENQALTLTINATDSNGDSITYSAANLPTGASFTGQTFSWTPTFTQAGSYNVTFTASDGKLQTSQTVTITVVDVDRPPVLAAIGSKAVEATKPLSFVLSATDPDGDNLTYSADGLPSGAALTGQTFAWTPTSSQIGTCPVTFTVSDGQLTDSETVNITVAGVLKDQIAPAVEWSPTPDAIQVPLNNLVTLHITDANSGVDANSVAIRVDGSIVYQGNVDVYTSSKGQCSRSGTKNDYRFIYQPNAMFGFDQTVAVSASAADQAGNLMSERQISFTTEMRAFGRNQPVSSLGGYTDSQPATACDPAGNLWVAWHAGTIGSRDIYVTKRPAGASTFETPVRLTKDRRDQCNPALAVSPAGAVYVVWQDNRNGYWDIYASVSSDGVSFSNDVQVTSSTRNEVNPALAIDHQSPGRVYVAWQDDRSGNQDIYVASSTDNFATSTVAQVTSNTADQTEPTLTVDAGNVVYIFWTDMRNGQADIYAAASSGGVGAWANVPVVTGLGEQTQPAVAAGAGDTLHLVWVENSGGNKDIYYAALNSLPGSPVAGVSIVDDTSGADQAAPAIVCSPDQRVLACWTDWRHTDATNTDTDLYVAELRSGTAATNILVGDDGTDANQGDPAIGVDRYGEPYLVWTDYRGTTPEIYSAATTLIDPDPVDAKVVVAAAGATIGTDPAAINSPEDVSVVVPAGACEADLRMTISRILNPQVSSEALLASYEFGPSGSDFDHPVTVTIPYTTSTGNRRVLPYWYDSVTGALSQQGITDVEDLRISSKLHALQFRTTHFTPFYLVDADADGAAPGTGGAAGGCAISPSEEGSPSQLLVPYAAVGVIMMILRRRDRRKGSGLPGHGMKG
jgi:PKD repeat protein